MFIKYLCTLRMHCKDDGYNVNWGKEGKDLQMMKTQEVILSNYYKNGAMKFREPFP